MIAISNVFLGFAVVCAGCGVVSGMLITGALQKRGVKINWIWLRFLLVSRYLDQYRDVTRAETGRTGPLFHLYLISMNLALAAAIVGIVLRLVS
jgi:hypothetical protein